MEIGLVMGLFFLLCTVIFVFIAIFLPEWIGITGKKAHEIMKEHVDQAHGPSTEGPHPTQTTAKGPSSPDDAGQ